ncbi:MAG: RNA 2',3'-cyclic phosphodiesterase [Verrucomicrobiota bacterium]|jgi:2'-5' RNA ligase
MMADSSTQKLRLFVAIPVPEAVRNEVIRVQRELRRLVPPDAIRWTKPEQFHLTLRFLGDVSSDRVAALKESVHTVCSGESALRLCAQGVGFFPNTRSPRVVWAGVNDGEGRLADLQKKIESAVQLFTKEPGTERFAGHMTLGRVKFLKRPEIEKLAAHAQTVKDRLLGEWTAQEIEIIRSELSPEGARYTSLAVFQLGAEIEPLHLV